MGHDSVEAKIVASFSLVAPAWVVAGEHRGAPGHHWFRGSGERLLTEWLVLGRGVRLDAVLQLGRKLAAVLFAFLLDRLHCRLRDVLAAFERLLAGVSGCLLETRAHLTDVLLLDACRGEEQPRYEADRDTADNQPHGVSLGGVLHRAQPPLGRDDRADRARDRLLRAAHRGRDGLLLFVDIVVEPCADVSLV